MAAGDLRVVNALPARFEYLRVNNLTAPGEVIDILVRRRKNRQAATRFFLKILKHQCETPRRIITDKLPSYAAARNDVMPGADHCQDRYAEELNVVELLAVIR